jgi:hypothetical protein
MNWYNRQLKISQGVQDWNKDQHRRMPEDIREVYEYYKGEDEPIDRNRQYILRNERANDLSEENNIRFERNRKVSIHEEEIKQLEKQLEDIEIKLEEIGKLPHKQFFTSDQFPYEDLFEQREEIDRKIGRHRSAISGILNIVPKHRKRKERLVGL